MHAVYLVTSIALAGATEYKIELSIDRQAPISGVISLQAFSTSAVLPLPSQVIQSSWSYVKCEISGEMWSAIFTASSENWPTSWPESAVCEVTDAGETLRAVISMPQALQPRAQPQGPPDPCGEVFALAGPEYVFKSCALPEAPLGTNYANPAAAVVDSNGYYWYESNSIQEASPEPRLTCSLALTGSGKTILRVAALASMQDTAGSHYECPLRLREVGTDNYSWGEPQEVALHR